MVERLSHAITDRRRCFAYWYRHSLKLLHAEDRLNQWDRAPEELKTPSSLREDYTGTTSKFRPLSEGELAPGLSHTHGPQTLASATEFSKYRKNLNDVVDTETVMSYATTAKDVDGKSAELPPPPLDAYSKPEFICPYCHIVCPSNQGRGRLWRYVATPLLAIVSN